MLPLFTPSPGSRAVTEESGKGWKIRAHFAKVEIKLFKAKWWHRLERGMLLMLTADHIKEGSGGHQLLFWDSFYEVREKEFGC